MVKIKYVGPKADFRDDSVVGTKTFWRFRGDVQDVADAHVPKFLAHPDVFELAVDDLVVDTTPVAPDAPVVTLEHVFDGSTNAFQLRDPASGEVTDLTSMDDAALKSFARVNGIKADLRKRGDELRAAIVATVVVETQKGA